MQLQGALSSRNVSEDPSILSVPSYSRNHWNDPGRKLNGCDTGDAKITKGYNLPSCVPPYLLHSCGALT